MFRVHVYMSTVYVCVLAGKHTCIHVLMYVCRHVCIHARLYVGTMQWMLAPCPGTQVELCSSKGEEEDVLVFTTAEQTTIAVRLRDRYVTLRT